MNNYSSAITKVVTQALYKTFMWMSIGLFLTAFTSYFLSQTSFIFYFFHNSLYGSLFQIIIIVAYIAVALSLRLGFSKFSYNTLKLLFIAFSTLSGMLLSYIFLIYELSSIIGIFFITAGMFFGLCIYGLITKKDLTPLRTFATMVFAGLLIFSIINLFVRSAMFNNMLNIVGVFLFSLLTAIDIQNIKKSLSEYAYDKEMQSKLSIIGAVIMYKNFINIFIRLLELFGKRKKN